MAEDLIKQKQQAIEDHFRNFVDTINNMNKRIDDALKDDQKKVTVGAEFLTTIKANVSIDISSTLGMSSSDKVQYAKLWFDAKQKDLDTLKEISTEAQKSFIETLDKQIEICRSEIGYMEEMGKR